MGPHFLHLEEISTWLRQANGGELDFLFLSPSFAR